jgi:hypothetical protein
MRFRNVRPPRQRPLELSLAIRLSIPCLLIASGFALSIAHGLAAEPKTRNIIFVMTDGFRWQDAFRGADPDLLDKKRGGVADPRALRQEFWRADAKARREALLPFFWSVIAREGQIYGNRDLGSDAFVTNGLNFSYPGYSEALCGFPDQRIHSNDKVPNPNVNVLEWLSRRPGLEGRIAAFGAWDVFPYILNVGRSRLLVNAGYEPFTPGDGSPALDLLNVLKRETDILDGEPFDAFTFHTALHYLTSAKPRVLFLSLGETDEWAHAGRYDLYLKAARRFDRYVGRLWDAAQSMPEYKGTTTLILAVDHGRGRAPLKWKSHGQKLAESKYVWMAFLGPDTPALGERPKTGVTQSQIAATLAALLGEDYSSSEPKAEKPISDVLLRSDSTR